MLSETILDIGLRESSELFRVNAIWMGMPRDRRGVS